MLKFTRGFEKNVILQVLTRVRKKRTRNTAHPPKTKNYEQQKIKANSLVWF